MAVVLSSLRKKEVEPANKNTPEIEQKLKIYWQIFGLWVEYINFIYFFHFITLYICSYFCTFFLVLLESLLIVASRNSLSIFNNNYSIWLFESFSSINYVDDLLKRKLVSRWKINLFGKCTMNAICWKLFLIKSRTILLGNHL